MATVFKRPLFCPFRRHDEGPVIFDTTEVPWPAEEKPWPFGIRAIKTGNLPGELTECGKERVPTIYRAMVIGREREDGLTVWGYRNMFDIKREGLFFGKVNLGGQYHRAFSSTQVFLVPDPDNGDRLTPVKAEVIFVVGPTKKDLEWLKAESEQRVL